MPSDRQAQESAIWSGKLIIMHKSGVAAASGLLVLLASGSCATMCHDQQ